MNVKGLKGETHGKENKIYKFKNVKHSVFMKLIEVRGGNYILENKDYKGLIYIANPEEVEEVKDDRD